MIGLKKAVIPAAGLGIRLLPATKEQPKEMLPVFSRLSNGTLCVKPFLQLVFENLYDIGFNEFCFIVGRGKRSIEDHFTIDPTLMEHLSRNNREDLLEELGSFYRKVSQCNIVFVNQPEPMGFGNAVFQARHFTGNESFMVHAGDDLIVSKNNTCLRRLIKTFEDHHPDALLFVKEVEDPQRYGVIKGQKMNKDMYCVESIEEKPLVPISNLAIIAVYTFSPNIYASIEETVPDLGGEIQLTHAIQSLIEEGHSVYALELKSNEKRIDIGTPESYRNILRTMRFPVPKTDNDLSC